MSLRRKGYESQFVKMSGDGTVLVFPSQDGIANMGTGLTFAPSGPNGDARLADIPNNRLILPGGLWVVEAVVVTRNLDDFGGMRFLRIAFNGVGVGSSFVAPAAAPGGGNANIYMNNTRDYRVTRLVDARGHSFADPLFVTATFFQDSGHDIHVVAAEPYGLNAFRVGPQKFAF